MITVSIGLPTEADLGPGLDLARLAAAVAAHLPGCWSVTAPRAPFVCLVKDDYELSCRFESNGKEVRMRITGVLPEGSHRCTALRSTSITASAVRGAAHIAKHVQARLLPGYQADVVAASRALERLNDRHDRLRASVERVRDLVPAADRPCPEFPGQTGFYAPGSCVGTFRALYGSGECDLQFERLPEPVAFEALALIADRLGLAPATHPDWP